ncbi:MAG TPA: NlpC/P60 family protein [Ureibacillus sp.]|uniref:C40 family peptidase n=1 Tax=Peribacillus asahii TaxID=228899 RepID=UPI00207A2DAE|nr:NlpC/P60 family protein [Peribacillus asahii]USK57926.1 NlpC/P60 family protein [Peribacillus asahii]HWL26807.1 NlpC/P60 family protein [Ureibacillus sp.]
MKRLVACFVIAGTVLSSPINSNAALGDRTLKSGMEHEDVRELQTVLKKKGYFTNKTITNYYGSITKKSVIKFQKANNLKADGIVGPNTFKALGVQKNSVAVSTSNQSTTNKLVDNAKQYLRVPYVWGGTSPSGFDCSGYLKYVFQQSIGINLPRTVAEIYKQGTTVSTPKVGDLVFYETYKPGASHAGIYIGNRQFIHSQSTYGVSISSMDNSYWSKRYIGAKQYIN